MYGPDTSARTEPNAPKLVERSSVNAELQQLKHQSSMFNDLGGKLQARLAPVLRQAAPAANHRPDPPGAETSNPQCELAGALRNVVEQNAAAIDRLAMLLTLLDV